MPTTQFTETTKRSFWVFDQEMVMATRQGNLSSLQVGDDKNLTLRTYNANGSEAGQARNITSAVATIIDVDRTTTGTTTGTGSTTTLVDTSRTEADDFWNGVPITITIAGTEYQTQVTDFVQSTHTLTIVGIPVAVPSSATYVLSGYPVLAQTAMTVSGNTASITVDSANLTARPMQANIIATFTYTDTEVETFVGRIRVYANLYA